MHSLIELMHTRIASGLKRKSIDKCSKWAEAYRMMNKGLWTFKNHRWLQPMHDTEAEMNVGQKAAQMGFTEWAMNMTFYKIDVEGVDCLYILPTEGDASNFSSGRFDPALEAAPYLQTLFSDVSNVGHKRAGQYSLYVRGSKSRSKLKSIPTGFIVFDEVDEMEQENIPLAMERASGQLTRQFIKISTPTLEDVGINKDFKNTTQEHFFFKCPGCSKLIELIFPDSIAITAEDQTDPKLINSYYKCNLCEKRLDHETKFEYLKSGIYVPQFADRPERGFTVNQMYSGAKAGEAPNIAKAYLKSLLDPTDEQEFFNSKLAITHAVAGAKITDTQLEQCIGNYRKGTTTSRQIITMGVDVGGLLHVEIDLWTDIQPNQLELSKCRVLYEGTPESFSELDKLMNQYGVWFCVVDRHPETRAAYAFATRFWGRVLLCMYGRGVNGKNVQVGTEEECTISVNRTSWLDLSLGRFHNNTISIPFDVSADYKKQVKEPTRVYERDSDGNPVGRYQNAGPDHFAHARNYAEIALLGAMSQGSVQNIGRVI